ADEEGRENRVSEVYRSLLNAEQAIKQDGIILQVNQVPTFYLGEMDKGQPDEESKHSLLEVTKEIAEKHRAYADQFIPPIYEYKVLKDHLYKASEDFRAVWRQYLYGEEEPSLQKPWQSMKAFNKRIYWGEEEYQDLKPVAQIHQALINTLD